MVGANHYISNISGGGGDVNFMFPDACTCYLANGITDGKECMAAVRRSSMALDL